MKRRPSSLNSGLCIRSYRPDDRKYIREICCTTAFRNQGHSLLFEDGDVFADYWTEYYVKYEPEHCFVAEKEGKVVGYLLGCSDSERFMRVMKRVIVPRILIKVVWRMLTFQYRDVKTYRYVRWALFKGRREMPEIPLNLFQAHFHLNLLQEGMFRRGFSMLLAEFLEILEEKGVPGIYGIVLEPVEEGAFTRLVASARSSGLKEDYYREKSTSLFRDVLKDERKMVNRAFGTSVAAYRKFVNYLSDRYNLL